MAEPEPTVKTLFQPSGERKYSYVFQINDELPFVVDGISFRTFIQIKNSNDFSISYIKDLIQRKLCPSVDTIEKLYKSIDGIHFERLDTGNAHEDGEKKGEQNDPKMLEQTCAPSREVHASTSKVSKSSQVIKKKTGKSNVWAFFVQSNAGGQCKLCFKDVKGLNTTNLKNHLMRNHQDVYGGQMKHSIPGNRSTVAETDDEFADEIDRQEPVVSPDHPPAKKARVSAIEQSSRNRSLACQPRIDNAVRNMYSLRDGGIRANSIMNALVFMISKDDMPLSMTEKPGFQHLMKVASPLFKIPGRTAVTAAIERKYDVLSSLVKQKLVGIPNFTLTMDTWTDTMTTKSFLGCTAHFLEEDKERLSSVILGVLELDQRHQSDYIRQNLLSLCSDWNIPLEKIVSVVTDNASNMKKAVVDGFGVNKHFPCFAHTLNLVLTTVLNDLDVLKQLITKIKTIITFFKHSTPAADELRKSQPKSPLRLIQDVCTRWNSTYYMLERFLDLINAVSSVLLKIPKSPPMLTAEEVAVAHEVMEILRPAEITTKELSGQNYITASNIMPMINCLKQAIAAVVVHSKIGETVQENLVNEINRRFQGMEKNNLIGIATLLDPRFKRLHFPTATSAAKTVETINQMLKSDPLNTNTKATEETIVLEQHVPNEIWKFHADLMKNKYDWDSEMNTTSAMDVNLKQYLIKPLTALNSNSIGYWMHQKENCPQLAAVALKYLSGVGTSTPCERLFSLAGNILNEHRNRLSAAHLSQLLFLKSLDVSEWRL